MVARSWGLRHGLQGFLVGNESVWELGRGGECAKRHSVVHFKQKSSQPHVMQTWKHQCDEGLRIPATQRVIPCQHSPRKRIHLLSPEK